MDTGTRTRLFACVPDWQKSELKSSHEILEKYGYKREGRQKLNCQLSCNKINSQGLSLSVTQDELREFHQGTAGRSEVCTWPLELLHERLIEKHGDTFFIKVEEWPDCFKINEVTHRSKPSITSFDRLLRKGSITVDHLMEIPKGKTRAHEKGPLFKIEPKYANQLFSGPTKKYRL